MAHGLVNACHKAVVTLHDSSAGTCIFDYWTEKRSLMQKQEMMNLLLEMLSEPLSGSDFRLKRSEVAYVRQISGGRQMLGLPLWDYHPDFEFSLNICIRLNAVEEIFHQFSGSPPKYHGLSFTTITRLEYFTGGPARYKATTAADVKTVSDILRKVIQDNVIPFLKEHEDVQALDRAVNRQPPGVYRTHCIDVTQNPSGAMHAVILARLAGNESYENIVSEHRTELKLASDVAHPFNDLVAYLKTL